MVEPALRLVRVLGGQRLDPGARGQNQESRFLGALGGNTAVVGLFPPGSMLALLGGFYTQQGTLHLGWVIGLAWRGRDPFCPLLPVLDLLRAVHAHTMLASG